MFWNKKVIDKIYMGCGDDYKNGYVGCDVRKTKTAKIICKAWELSKYCKNVGEIYSINIKIKFLITPNDIDKKYTKPTIDRIYEKY